MTSYPIPEREVRKEIRVVNSRFIATVAPALTVDQAKEFISRIRNEFADASHNVPAFLIGYGSSVTAHCSDDGEPSGTAGRPVLSVLRGSGLGDVVLVITRYFGGTKLGTGGLVRAYSEAARQVLDLAPRAVKVATQTLLVVVPYSLYEQLGRLIAEY
ncbi:MAG: YigZ family protein, partial [Anaerolineales bacterium]|nr:YigZ family protein [Anaerolineales bacterium]